jgi:hypothetical protein
LEIRISTPEPETNCFGTPVPDKIIIYQGLMVASTVIIVMVIVIVVMVIVTKIVGTRIIVITLISTIVVMMTKTMIVIIMLLILKFITISLVVIMIICMWVAGCTHLCSKGCSAVFHIIGGRGLELDVPGIPYCGE